MPDRGARIQSVDLPIHEAVERHRGRSCRRHAKEDAKPVARATVPAIGSLRRQGRAEEGEGQGEEGVAELDHPEQVVYELAGTHLNPVRISAPGIELRRD